MVINGTKDSTPGFVWGRGLQGVSLNMPVCDLLSGLARVGKEFIDSAGIARKAGSWREG